MEAIAYHNQAGCFKSVLQTGMTYDFIRVGFCPTEILDGHIWNLAMEFVVKLQARTEVRISACKIQATLYPPCFPQFDVIFSLWDNSITGASSLTLHLQNFILFTTKSFILITFWGDVLAYVDKIQYERNLIYDCGIPFLEIGLMNFRWAPFKIWDF